ncbi:SDR family oxidoreductase [Sphingobium baderi]|uniref:SDR family oxidoreductase n=1 Tax=Sphingobium baderi TaxID=1332080 RepID=UPI000AE56E25|nr:SDR family oxidoreductase [Sphingobium baderi]
MDDFYAARSRTIPPLPWSNIAPPFSEVGALVAFLCSQDAGYITGQYIVVDGGYMQAYH